MAITAMGWPGSLLLVGLLLMVFVARVCEAALHYHNGVFMSEPRLSEIYLYQAGNEGLYASDSGSYLQSGMADGKSVIRLDKLVVRRSEEASSQFDPNQPSSGLVQAVVFEVGDRRHIGYQTQDGYQAFCCTDELEKITPCNVGQVIVNVRNGWPKVVNANFAGVRTTATFPPEELIIDKTGMYFMVLFVCDPHLKNVTLSVSGTTTWKNPHGYLPGMMIPLLTFYGALSVAYLLMGCAWLSLYAKFWKDVLQLQNCIALVIFLSMLEMTTWYFDYVNFNRTGRRPYGITVWAVTLGALRKTVSRTLILVVSMGYGVVRPTLGGYSGKVMLLGGAYFVASLLLDVMQNVGAIDDVRSTARVLLVLPVAVLDAIFILWIFSALSRTLAQLQARRQSAKLELYRKFTNALAIVVIVSVAWIGYEMYFKVSDQFNEYWQYDWVMVGFWHVLTFLLLVVICWLWSPSTNATRYAYSEDVADGDGSEETIALTSVGVVGSTSKSDLVSVPTTAASKMGGKSPMADGKNGHVNTDVFSLDEDDEPAKLE